jgi:hypothetical protein
MAKDQKTQEPDGGGDMQVILYRLELLDGKSDEILKTVKGFETRLRAVENCQGRHAERLDKHDQEFEQAQDDIETLEGRVNGFSLANGLANVGAILVGLWNAFRGP